MVYDTAVIKNTPLENLSGTGINNDTAGDYSTVDGASTTKNQDMGRWVRQTGVTLQAGAIHAGEESKTPADVLNKTAAFYALKSLSVNDNKIGDWASVDAIDNFPGVEMLRLQHNPINTDIGISSSILRQTIIARIGSLKSLNGGEVRSTERADAEKLYIKRILQEYVKTQPTSDPSIPVNLSHCLKDIIPVHPRASALLDLHGEPAVRRVNTSGK